MRAENRKDPAGGARDGDCSRHSRRSPREDGGRPAGRRRALHQSDLRYSRRGGDDPHAERKKYAGRMLVGAGTVLDTETCRTAILAGADFILSPTLNTEVVRMCNRLWQSCCARRDDAHGDPHGTGSGCRHRQGLSGGRAGAAYIKDVKGPLKQACIMAVGGSEPGKRRICSARARPAWAWAPICEQSADSKRQL